MLVLLLVLLPTGTLSALANPTPPIVAGTETTGGLGGRVLKVTSLAAAGPGSLRAALDTTGPRVVVFEVGGVIDLDRTTLTVVHPFVTIAGATAPDPGITLIRGGLQIATHDVAVSHLRIRPGDAGLPRGSGWEPDALCVAGADACDVRVDHCSLSWAVDENLSVSGPRTDAVAGTARRVTLSNCIVAEGLQDATHGKGPHSKGSLIHDGCRSIAVIGNLYAHNVDRNPYFKAFCTGVIANNLIYNPGRAAIRLNWVRSEWWGTGTKPVNPRVSVIGNLLVHGPDTRWGLAMVAGRGDAFLADNTTWDIRGRPARITGFGLDRLRAAPAVVPGMVPVPASRVLDRVLATAGARPAERDAIDTRIVNEVRNRTGGIRNSQDEVGGYPRHPEVRRPLDPPQSPDRIAAWLEEFDLQVETGTQGVSDDED